MNDPVLALFSYAMEEDIYLQYMDDPKKYWADRRANDTIYDRLRAQLDLPAQKLLEELLEEQTHLDSIETEAAFTAGLAFGLRLSQLS